MPIRLLHTADVHLGARFPGLGDKGAVQREQVRASFKKLVSLALAEAVDIVLIAGDLFDANQQPQRNFDLVLEQFSLLAAKKHPRLSHSRYPRLLRFCFHIQKSKPHREMSQPNTFHW